MSKTVELMESIYDDNDRIAARVNAGLEQKGIYAVNVMGTPGAGKTSCLMQIIKRLKGLKPYVIEGDIQSDIDTKKLTDVGVETIQINTGGACHLDGTVIENTLSKFEFDEKGILFIENIGNLVCPAEFEIGEHIKLLVSSVAEGSDKPYKYPLAFEKAAVILVNKVDLLPHLDFDMHYYMQGVRVLNKTAPIFEVSGKTGEGFDEVAKWLMEKIKQ